MPVSRRTSSPTSGRSTSRSTRSTTSRTRRAIGVVLAAAALGPTAPADAYRIGGDPWPGERIVYAAPPSGYEDAVRRAVRAWNGAGLSIRFARAPRSQADVTFRYFRRGPRCGGGIPGLGWPGPDAPPVPIYLARRCPVAGIRALTVAHELGHVLGLAHENRVCALMNPFHLRGGGSRCDQSRAAVRARYRTLLEPDDVEGALHLYGPRS